MARWRFCISLLILVAVLGGSVVATQARLSGRIGVNLSAYPIPTSLTDEIQLDTPSELAVFRLGLESTLILNATFAGVDFALNTASCVAGPERLIFSATAKLDELNLKGVTLSGIKMVPEMWFAVPFEAVTDVNNFPNSVVISPGDMLFVKTRLTVSMTIAGFNLKYLLMFEDVNFPSPSADFSSASYGVQSQSYALGSIISASWVALNGVSFSSTTYIGADASSNSVKGHSASGSVNPDSFFETFSVGGIEICGFSYGKIVVSEIRLGQSITINPSNPIPVQATTSISFDLTPSVRFSTSLMLSPCPPAFGGFSVAIAADCFNFSLAFNDFLDLTSFNAISVAFNTRFGVGSLTGSFRAGASIQAGTGLTGLTGGLSLTEGAFSASYNVAFARQGSSVKFVSQGVSLNLRLSPAMVSFSATFGKNSLARASVSVGVVF